jgi:hypothetical protein
MGGVWVGVKLPSGFADVYVSQNLHDCGKAMFGEGDATRRGKGPNNDARN